LRRNEFASLWVGEVSEDKLYVCPYCGMTYYTESGECPYCREAEYEEEIGEIEMEIEDLKRVIRKALYFLEQNRVEDAKKELRRALRVEEVGEK